MHKAYEVIISQDSEQPEKNAIANATSKLNRIAAESRTEFDIFDVNVYDGENGRAYGIGLCAAIDATEAEHDSLINSLDSADTVESIEEVHHEPL